MVLTTVIQMHPRIDTNLYMGNIPLQSTGIYLATSIVSIPPIYYGYNEVPVRVMRARVTAEFAHFC